MVKTKAALKCSRALPPVGAMLCNVEYAIGVPVEWSDKTEYISSDGLNFFDDGGISRYLISGVAGKKYDGLLGAELDSWVQFASQLALTTDRSSIEDLLYALNTHMKTDYITEKTPEFLLKDEKYYVDLVVCGALYNVFRGAGPAEMCDKRYANVACFYNGIMGDVKFGSLLKNIAANYKPGDRVTDSLSIGSTGGEKAKSQPKNKPEKKSKDEGKFVELPGAEMGKVVVRFPPEASGYLHIGHAKAALLNQYYQQTFNGQLIMRFDDTNPAKESSEFEQVIIEDLAMLGVKPDRWTRTSDHFDVLLKFCEQLLQNNQAYVDDTEPEQMKKERELRQESKNRSNSPATNLKIWKEMVAGSAEGQKCAVRMKIDMQSNNGCLRDPTIYRCKPEPHVQTGTKYKVYPTYDFACPIVDSIEGVTHALRTTEYHDRDDQYYFIIDALKLRKPYIWEYARLNMLNTVMSKRKLTWIVDQGIVEGWDDPRFPTVRGVLRRGMTVEGLKQFIVAQGGSKSIVLMEWDKIWSFNKKVIDPSAPRYTTVTKNSSVVMNIDGPKLESTPVALHPKNTEIGQKNVWFGPKVLIEAEDATLMKEDDLVTLVNWGNVRVTSLKRSGDFVMEVNAKLELENKDFKNTMKVSWLAETPSDTFCPVICAHFDYLMTANEKDADFKSSINRQSWHNVEMIGEHGLKNLKKGQIIQLLRKGYYICDRAYEYQSLHSIATIPCVLFHIPDGHTKVSGTAVKIPAKGAESAAPVVESKAPESPSKSPTATVDTAELDAKIKIQGELVRKLKSEKADKPRIDAAVAELLSLKKQLQQMTGVDVTAGAAGDKKKKGGKKEQPQQQQPAAAAPVVETKAPESPSKPPTATVDTAELDAKIKIQGELVRKLKSEKADKPQIDAAVAELLSLKKQLQQVTGVDMTVNSGDKLSEMQTSKMIRHACRPAPERQQRIMNAMIAAAAPVVETKAPESPSKPPTAAIDTAELDAKIKIQGELVRKLKSEKADKPQIDTAVAELLSLKKQLQQMTGVDMTVNSGDKKKKGGKKEQQPQQPPSIPVVIEVPSTTVPVTSLPSTSNQQNAEKLEADIKLQGEKVRTLKSEKAEKKVIDVEVAALLSLKEQLKLLTGQGSAQPSSGQKSKKSAEKKPQKEQQKPNADKKGPEKQEVAASAAAGVKKITRLGLEVTKEENFSEWYSQVIIKAEMIEYYDVSGCYILRPWAFAIWEVIQEWFDAEIKKLGVSNCYFPMFVSQQALEREKDHISDFAPEVAWVTRSGDTEMAEPVAIRPTSETVMYPTFAKWVQSYRDLPIRLNQWCSVVRWEFKHPTPFLRTREFLWQEGHTAWDNAKDACDEVRQILDLYAKVYEDLLAVPVIKGRKTEKEKFAGGDFTTTIEAYIPMNGRAIQAATSHHLGQNFSKMFEIVFDHPETSEKTFAFQNSWGLTTRSVGVMTMVHGDNSGLVLPPRVAKIQAVIIPCGITASISPEDKETIMAACRATAKTLKDSGLRVDFDSRDNYSPGWKHNHWELKGVPVRIEVGPRDVKEKQVVVVRRDTSKKIPMKMENLAADLNDLMNEIHRNLFDKARLSMVEHTITTDSFDVFRQKIDEKFMVIAPFCGIEECEDNIKKDSASETVEAGAPSMGAKALCIPFEQPECVKTRGLKGKKCVHPLCGKDAICYTLFGRSY